MATHIREMDRLKKMETSRNAEKKYITQALRKGARKGLGLKGSSRRLQQRLTAVEIRKGEIEPLRRALRGHLSEARIAIRKKAKVFIQLLRFTDLANGCGRNLGFCTGTGFIELVEKDI